jgi:hypothetical protein
MPSHKGGYPTSEYDSWKAIIIVLNGFMLYIYFHLFEDDFH